MSIRLVSTLQAGSRIAKVYRDSEWEEWRVQFYTNAVKEQNATYHTADKADALATAHRWVGSLNLSELFADGAYFPIDSDLL